MVDRGHQLRGLRRVRPRGDRRLHVPRNGDTLSLVAANGFTCVGGLCFLVGAVLGLAADAAAQDVAAPADVVAER